MSAIILKFPALPLAIPDRVDGKTVVLCKSIQVEGHYWLFFKASGSDALLTQEEARRWYHSVLAASEGDAT